MCMRFKFMSLFKAFKLVFIETFPFFFLFTCFQFTCELIKLCSYNSNTPGIDRYENRHTLGRLIFGKLNNIKVGSEDSMMVCKYAQPWGSSKREEADEKLTEGKLRSPYAGRSGLSGAPVIHEEEGIADCLSHLTS